MNYFRLGDQQSRNPTAQESVLEIGRDGLTHAVRKLCKTNFLVFQKVELGLEIGPQHKQWWDRLRTLEDVCEMAPRDHGKSHSLARAYPIWKLKYDDWVKEVLILGADQPSAVENLDKIKDLMADHGLSYLIPKGRYDGANSRTEVKLTNGKNIKAKGIGSPLRGRHPQLIILDDVLNEKNSWSMESRKEIIDNFNEVIVPMKDKGLPKDRAKGYKSQIVVIGTAQDYDDLYHYLQSNEEYVGEKLTAIKDFETEEVLWPDRYSFDDLIRMKGRIGSLSFAKEYQNDPMTDETTIFPSTLFTPLFDKDLSYVRNYSSGNPVYLGMDFSIPGNTDGDWTVLMVVEYDPSSHIYTILNYWRAKPSEISEQIKQIEYHCQMYNVTLGYLEDNMFQGIYREHFRKNSNLPVKGHTVTHSGKKSMEHGIVSLRPLLENFLFRFPYKTQRDKDLTDTMVSEFNGIRQRHGKIGNETTHDDIVLALWHAICASRQVVFEADF